MLKKACNDVCPCAVDRTSLPVSSDDILSNVRDYCVCIVNVLPHTIELKLALTVLPLLRSIHAL